MYNILNKYLFLKKSIPLPGLGTISMESLPATVDTSTRTILPPAFRFRFDKFFDSPDKDLFVYLSSQQNISDYEALRLYNDFTYTLRDKLNYSREVTSEGLGTLIKDARDSRKRRAAMIALARLIPLSLPCLISITVSTASRS